MYSVKVIENFNGVTTEPQLVPVHQANPELEAQIKEYAKAKAKLDRETKLLSIKRDKLEKLIVNFESVVDSDGIEMLTFRFSKKPERFDKDKFEKERPEMYKQYIFFGNASRTLSLKI